MKHRTKLCVLFLLIFIMTGCGNTAGGRTGVNNGNSVDTVINEQVEKSGKETASVDSEGATSEAGFNADSPQEAPEKTVTADADGVDYDLTAMSSDMVYATVYQMMVDPGTYIGKTFRMEGLYYANYYEPTAQYYHYCIIQDATACCAQGLEFVWEDGSHTYPDEYPKDNTEVIVEGTFETYREDGDNNLYCRLKDATLEVKK